MIPLDQRAKDRTTYFTMKTTSGLPLSGSAHSHSRTNSQSFFSSKPSSTPMGSPRPPHSVGQPFPPKLSPSASRTAAQDARTPSPNYFGLTIEPAVDPRDSSVMPRENWSSPTSSVKSFAAAIPKQLPLDANPEFEAFRRQVDANRGRSGFNLTTTNFNLTMAPPHTPAASTPSALQRPRPPRWQTAGSENSDAPLPRMTGPVAGLSRPHGAPSGKPDADVVSLQDSAYVSGDSKRNSEASLNAPSFFSMGRYESPAQMGSPFGAPERVQSNVSLSRVEDRHPRLSLAQGMAGPPSPGPAKQYRAGTVPPVFGGDETTMMAPSQLRDLIVGGHSAEVLLLDLRVSPQFAQARVKGALNLCIPTTLLKRATFNLQKLQQTFQAEQDQEKFANWRNTKYLVVYDAFSSEKRDAVSGMNMLKKFTAEGYSGSANILRGGFQAFAEAYPDLVDRSACGTGANLSLGHGSVSNGLGPSIAPVIGGVMLPTTSSQPNPFFSNIRQNQDLVDGVGQMDIGLPSGLHKDGLPRWLREAAETSDHGKKVSEKFLEIELTEQSRMRDAYSVSHTGDSKVQLSGIEKGGKNRYKDILPFEHARVRLQDRPEGACDYVNASHIQASRSHKRYIASQGPLPATFEDFWSVIWDQDVRVIVMLTAESEGGQLKCHPYWKGRDFGSIKLRILSEKKVSLDIDKHRSTSSATPTPTSQASNGPSTVSAQNSFSWNPSQGEIGRRRANTTTNLESNAPTPSQPQQSGPAAETPFVIIRKFALSHAAHPFSPIREITQLHYPSWPDFGAPAQPSHLLALVELANVMQRAALPVNVSGTSRHGSIGSDQDQGGPAVGSLKRGDSLPLSWHDAPESGDHVRPILVHCSAGCGRTGAFCTVDSVIDMLKRQRLRAVKKANKRINDRERRIAQQLEEEQTRTTKRQALNRPDMDGDTAMVDPLSSFDEPVSDASHSGAEDDSSKSSGREGERIDTSWLGDDSIDLIAKTVEDFRGQRLSMVQSLRQFVLCYETVIEWLERSQERSGGVTGGKGRGRSGSLAM
ncbi:hypothetical protein B0H66DRAFT_480543 [Apodospora peruviana]|uniref:protein-tyrosine-phosphatase n=1 Tax=Apodospora peruviana TaxID=516989 RepID=A0AAE0HX55_9PEZI|nr:hypothetical protein B0H66DRAFT_480543 [Apodospora peruviana]